MSNTVLAIIELDDFPDDVARRAAWIARQYDCDLELLLCDPTLSILGESFVISHEAQRLADSIRQNQERIIGAHAESLSSEHINITTNISHERPISDAIIARALECEPMFVVKGTHYHSPAERATFTYTDWRLIRKLNFPLWLVKPDSWKERPTIVAAVDPTHDHDKNATFDQKIIQTGQTLASRCGGKLLLLHTYQRLVEIGSLAMKTFKPVTLPIDELEKKMRDAHRRELDKLAAANNIPTDAVHQLPGRTREILPTFARAHGANIVVMGAVARTGLKRRVVGSTAEQVLDHIPCDILIVRSD